MTQANTTSPQRTIIRFSPDDVPELMEPLRPATTGAREPEAWRPFDVEW